MKGLTKRNTGLTIPALTDVGQSDHARSLDALKTEMREQERNRTLNEIDAWLLDQAEACDVDGAEWDAAFYRKVGQDLAERFKPC